MIFQKSFCRTGVVIIASWLLAGCGWIASAGPSENQVAALNTAKPSITVIDVDDAVAHRVLEAQKRAKFSETFSETIGLEFIVGAGDTLGITLWEAPPATLFATHEPRSGMASTQTTSFPEQMVAADGTVTIPFAGTIKAAGKSPQQIEADIIKRLEKMANRPQVLVQVTHNATSNVTIVGEVKQSLRMPLTAKGEKLMDALAASGGVTQPVDKMTVQISRGAKVLSMAMEDVISDPTQNIMLQAGDIVTALHQPFSFTVLGATGKNEEINFESKGITLAQALGRIGGLDDNRANAQGVFIFRFEDPAALASNTNNAPAAISGKTPVVYRINLKDPQTFLLAQNFPMNNKDVVYVANAPSTELQKFMTILYGSVFSAVNIKTL